MTAESGREAESALSPAGTRVADRRLGSGPPLVVVHGGLASSRSWLAVARLLRRSRLGSDDATVLAG